VPLRKRVPVAERHRLHQDPLHHQGGHRSVASTQPAHRQRPGEGPPRFDCPEVSRYLRAPTLSGGPCPGGSVGGPAAHVEAAQGEKQGLSSASGTFWIPRRSLELYGGRRTFINSSKRTMTSFSSMDAAM